MNENTNNVKCWMPGTVTNMWVPSEKKCPSITHGMAADTW